MLALNPYKIGNIAEVNIIARLVTLHRHVLKPIGEGFRYDLLVDNGDGTFTRGQCKNGRLRDGRIEFNTCSSGGFCKTPRRYYDGQADVFWIWCGELKRVYEVPVGVVPKSSMLLRVEPAKNGQNQKINLAAAYEL